jgi:ferritin-like metal-binding protein YciE
MLQMSDARQLLVYELGAALTMEETSVTMLRELSETTNASELREQLWHHRDETRGQIGNITQAFAALGYEPRPRPCPTIEGFKTERELLIQHTAPELHPTVILGGCVAVEHYEIAVYEGLITLADELELDDVSALLKENLEQEEHSLEEVEKAFERQAKTLAERVTA